MNTTTEMTQAEQEVLFAHNLIELNKMNVAAGSMVKGLLMELERDQRNTFIRLKNARIDGYTVFYEFIQGDESLVLRLGGALGLIITANEKIEVPQT